MKHTIKLIICLVLIAGCKKEPEPIKEGKVTFYQSEYPANTVLWIDGHQIYPIIATDSIPKCGEYWNGRFLTRDITYGWHNYHLTTVFKPSSDTIGFYVGDPCMLLKIPKP